MNKMDNHETEPNHFVVYEYDYSINITVGGTILWCDIRETCIELWCDCGEVQSCGVTAGK